jgi:hypothetical protein
MNHYHNHKFSGIEDFLHLLPKEELIIVQYLRAIILGSFPNPMEKLSYNVPYYFQHSRVCFIWPSSVPWGTVKKNGVMLGFVKGHLMRDEIGYLEQEGRKFLRSKTFYSTNEIDIDLVKTYIFEALEMDMLSNQRFL